MKVLNKIKDWLRGIWRSHKVGVPANGSRVMPVSPEVIAKIEYALSIREECNDKEQAFLDAMSKVITDGWHMTAMRLSFLEMIIKHHKENK